MDRRQFITNAAGAVAAAAILPKIAGSLLTDAMVVEEVAIALPTTVPIMTGGFANIASLNLGAMLKELYAPDELFGSVIASPSFFETLPGTIE